MANKSASFAVKLLDGISRPARAAGGALASLRKQMKQTMMVGKAGRTVDKQGRLREADGKFAKSKFGDGIQSANSGINKLIGGLGAATLKAGLLAGALAGVGAAVVLTGIAEAISFAERMRFALTNLTGSKSAGEEAFQRAGKLAQELGLNVEDTTKQYAKLLAAQFTVGRAETLIKLTSDLKAIGATAEETQSAIRAITQIKAKGKLQAEELVGQLAEAGIATTLVYDELAKKLGVSAKKVPAVITAGLVDAEMGIAAIEAAILKKVRSNVPGKVGAAYAKNLLDGATDRLKNAPRALFGKIAEASGITGISKLKGLVGQLQGVIDSISPKAAASAFHQIVDLARMGITLATEFAAGFGDGFGEIMQALNPGSIGDASKMFRQLGRDVAQLTVYAIEAAKYVGQFFSWLNSDPGKTTLAIGAIGVGLFKVLGLVGAVAGAFGLTAGTGLLATMGSFGLGVAAASKAIAALSSVVIGFGSTALAAITPIVLPILAVAGAFTAAYLAAKELLDLFGGTSALEAFGADLAGPQMPRAMKRGVGDQQVAQQPSGRSYPGAALTTAPSALVNREQLSDDSPILNAGKKAGDVSIANLNVQLPASAAASPRSHAAAFADALRSELGAITVVPGGV